MVHALLDIYPDIGLNAGKFKIVPSMTKRGEERGREEEKRREGERGRGEREHKGVDGRRR